MSGGSQRVWRRPLDDTRQVRRRWVCPTDLDLSRSFAAERYDDCIRRARAEHSATAFGSTARGGHAGGHKCQRYTCDTTWLRQIHASGAGDTRNVFRVSLLRRKRRFAATSHAGGGTRTPDTRIMIPLLLGSPAPFAGPGGHKRGHICTGLSGRPARFRTLRRFRAAQHPAARRLFAAGLHGRQQRRRRCWFPQKRERGGERRDVSGCRWACGFPSCPIRVARAVESERVRCQVTRAAQRRAQALSGSSCTAVDG